ncbi:MAG: Snf7 family protein [Candidatus Bathyarchaeia archaeon]
MSAFSIFKRVEDKLHPVPLKERIVHASFRLHAQLEKLDHMYTKLHQRDTDLFQRCVGAQASNDPGHAKIYANECAEIRKIAKVVLASQLALERVILRLETVGEFSEVMVEISPLMSIVKETKSKISGIVPQVATELDEVNNLLGDLTDEAGDVTTNNFTIETNDDEARKVLEETGLIAEQKVRDHFPDLSAIESSPSARMDSIPELATTIPDMEAGIEERVYDYARKHNGELSIHSCAQDIGKSPEEVKIAIQRLRDTGKVALE